MSRNDPFKKIGGLNPGRSLFNLSYRKIFDTHLGWIIPVMHDLMVPGDKFKISCEMLIRLNPLIAPIMHEINAFVHYFFVPYRIIWDGWVDFITGGPEGDDDSSQPLWQPEVGSYENYTLWDYFGFLVDRVLTGGPADISPIDFPLRAYNLVWNYYYRDQNISQERALTDDTSVALRPFEKDYFSTSLPFLQRGVAPAIPLTGYAPIEGIEGNIEVRNTQDPTAGALLSQSATQGVFVNNTPSGDGNLRWVNPQLRADLNNAATFDTADLRRTVQIQKFMERNARAGVRYQEFLRSHFNFSARDERLQYPEYLFGVRAPVIVSEVLQTSASGFDGGPTSLTPQGNLAGHGITSRQQYAGSFTAPEFGIIIGLFSMLPRTMYSQGINRQWLHETRYDYYFPEFAHLSEQPVLNAEIYASRVGGVNLQTFGYVGRYDEMRVKQDMAVGAMGVGGSLDYWHLGREFAETPTLNEEFIYCDGSQEEWQRIFAEQTAPNYLCHVGNRITAIRPIPVEGVPGFVDHN